MDSTTLSKMSSCTPINLEGGNLGERHHYLNKLVIEASANISFRDVEDAPEHSPIDRLFKISLASRVKNVDYIIRNLKENDMLYVISALKQTWLLNSEYRDIISPKNLDENLFPQMISPAVSKMIHWLYINLRDPNRCYEFYEHYMGKKNDLCLKFLIRCSNEFILDEFPKILNRITPQRLKVFCERCPKVAKIYFDALGVEEDVSLKYQSNAQAYQSSVISVLKSEPDIFLEIIEKYHNEDLKKLSPDSTKNIIRYHKDRFMAKPELYTAWILHLPTLAKHISDTESEELLMNLARAKFLDHWFLYKTVEPLVKRLQPDRRATLKKRVFVEKDIGDCVDNWPYPIPSVPYVPEKLPQVFDDPEYGPQIFDFSKSKRKILKKCVKRRGKCVNIQMTSMLRTKTELDRLYDEFRFIGFTHTFNELSRRIAAASNIESRRNILLVLVSKIGGYEDNVCKLLQLMIQHINEPANFRASIVRSLVKRACVWRLPADGWNLLLKFSHGLGFDGSSAEADCFEGLHAYIIRRLMSDNEIGPDLQKMLLENFSDFSDYTLTTEERVQVIAGVSRVLFSAAENSEPEVAGCYLERLFNVYKSNRVPINANSPIVLATKSLVKLQPNAAKDILSRLYKSRIARKELFVENLELRNDEAAYINIIRHDPNVVDPKHFVNLIKKNECLDRFTRKVALYYNERCGLGSRILQEIQQTILIKADSKLARSLAILIGRDFMPCLRQLDISSTKKENRRLAIAFRACAHLARPKLDFSEIEISEIGAKAVTIRAIICPNIDIEKLINKLLTSRQTVKTAMLLAKRNGNEPYVLKAAAILRPVPALKASLRYFRCYGDRADFTVWDVIKPIMLTLDLTDRRPLWQVLKCDELIPSAIRADYCITLYTNLSKSSVNLAIKELYHDMENLLPNMPVEDIENALIIMLSRNEKDIKSMVYPNLFVKYLLLCKSVQEQSRRFDTIGLQFLDRIVFLIKNLDQPDYEYVKHEYLNRILKCLKYSTVFYDTDYVSCEPVFERIANWMRNHFPVEFFFHNYVELKLTVLYYRAVRQSIKDSSDIFDDPNKKLKEGVDIIGLTFGRLIAKELNELISKYFESISSLYEEPCKNYFTDYFLTCSSSNQLLEAMLTGLMEEDVHAASRVGIYILKNCEYRLSTSAINKLKDNLKRKDIVTRFLLYAELY